MRLTTFRTREMAVSSPASRFLSITSVVNRTPDAS